MSVRTFSKVIPLSITDLLVTYVEDGVTKNVIVQDAALAASCWALQAQQAAAQQAHDSTVMTAQTTKNEVVGAAETDYTTALAAAQQAFTDAAAAAAQAKASAVAPIQDQIDVVTAQVFSAANKLLPPTDTTAQPATSLTPTASLTPSTP